MMYLKILEKQEQAKSKISRQKDTTKIRSENVEMET
jgi:hypothetical protein